MAKRAVRGAPAPAASTKKFADDLDVKLAKSWQKFKVSMADFFLNVKESAVELSFESQIDEKTFFSFASDEPVFVSDILITAKSKVAFTVAFGAKDKQFTLAEADCVSTTAKDGTKESLDRIITKNFREAFHEECADVISINMLERKYLQVHPELREVFNNVDYFLKEYEENKNKGQIYEKIDNFGIF